jgi:acetolactate synthase-1/2/3 large subunit
MGKSTIPNSRSLYAGVLGADPEAQEFADSADVIITVGYEIAEYGPEKWNRHKASRIVHVDYASAEENYFYPLISHPDRDWDSQIVGDIKRSLDELDRELDEDVHRGLREYVPENSDETLERIKKIQKLKLDRMMETEKGDPPFDPLAAIFAVHENISSDDILVCSVGTLKNLCARYLQIEKPGHFSVPNTLSPMGFALPFAIGAKLARPENRVIAICGDGSFKMSHSELEVAIEKRIPITVVVFNNNQLGFIAERQKSKFGKVYGTRFRQKTDYIEMAKSMGVKKASRSDSYEKIGEFLSDKSYLDEPVVIEIPIEAC